MRYSVPVNLTRNAGIGAETSGHRYGMAAIWLEIGSRPGSCARIGSNLPSYNGAGSGYIPQRERRERSEPVLPDIVSADDLRQARGQKNIGRGLAARYR